jgi:putative peptidoglycan lipid II flippase
VVVKNTLTISVFNALGLVSGFGLDVILAARFGLGREMDALFVALTLPQLILAVLYVAFNAVLVPAFSRVLEETGKERVWQLFSMIATSALLIFAALALLGVAASHLFIPLVGPGLDKSTVTLAIGLSRIVFWLILPAGLIHTMSAMLNAHQRFAAPAALHFAQYLVVIIFALLGISRWGVAAVALGYVVAAFVQVLMLAVGIRRIGGGYRFGSHMLGQETRKIAGLLWPSLLQGSLGQSSVLFERLLASFLPVGSISALAYARRIHRALSYIFADSVATALLPRLSSLSAQADTLGLKRVLAFGVRVACLVVAPAVALLVVLDVPVIRLAFERGAFDASATRLTAGAMALYVLSVAPLAVWQLTSNVFFAMRDTLTPLRLRMVTLSINFILDLLLISIIGIYALPLSLLVAYCLGVAGALGVLSRQIGELGLRREGYFAKLGLALSSLAGLALGVRLLWETRAPLSTLQQLAALLLASGLGLLAYAGVTMIAGIEEVEGVVRLVRERLSNAVSDPS